jgi:CelD/BcsL family acetyltransferase involved in cellulose biosynthesis
MKLHFTLTALSFGERSSFNMQQRRDVFKELFEKFAVDLFSIKLNGEPKAVSFAFLYNGSYITLNIGYDYDIRDISKLLVVTQLTRAIEKGCTRFDAGQGDNGWKSHFNLEKVPQYKLTLNVPVVVEE